MRNVRNACRVAPLMLAAGAVILCLWTYFARPSATTVRAAPIEKPENAPATQPSTRPVSALAAERLEAAAEGFRLTMRGYGQGLRSFDELGTWSRRQAEAALDPAIPGGQRINLLEQHLKQAQDLERVAALRFQAGVGGQEDVIGAKYLRLEAEIWLARAGEGGQPYRPAAPGGR